MKDFLRKIASWDEAKLRKELTELYTHVEEVRDHYSSKHDPEVPEQSAVLDEKLLDKYKKQVIKALYPNDQMRGGFDIEKVEEIIKKLNNKLKRRYYIEIGLFSVEIGTHLADSYGGDFGEEFFIYFEELFEDAVKTIVGLDLKAQYQKQLSVIADTAFEGYGYADQLQDILEIHFDR